MRFRVSFEFNADPENFENMTTQEAANLTKEQLDNGELYIEDTFELSDYETLKVEVVDN